MRIVLHTLLTSALLYFYRPEIQCQHVWPSEKHDYKIRLSEWWMVSDQHYDAGRELMDNIAEYGFYATILDATYGLSDRMAATLHFPMACYLYTRLPLSGSKIDGWKSGDAEVGLHYALLRDTSFTLLSAFQLGIPFSGKVGSQVTGDEQIYQHLSLGLTRKLPVCRREGWWAIQMGYRNRAGHKHNEWHYSIAMGLEIDADKFSASIALSGMRPFGQQVDAQHIQPESLFSNYREVHVILPEIQLQISPAVTAGIGIDIPLAGRNRFANMGYGLHLEYGKN
jgi:hypothetical protein